MLITDCPTIEIASRGVPKGMEARVAPDGEIVFWDGRRQYYTGAKEDGPELRKAIRHHRSTVWPRKTRK